MDKEIIPPEMVTEICGHIRLGASFEVAALAVGLSVDQVAEAFPLLAGAKNGYYKELASDIKKAMAQFEVMQLMKINAEGGPSGARWLLERTMPNKWGVVEKTKTTKPNQIPKQNEINITDFQFFQTFKTRFLK